MRAAPQRCAAGRRCSPPQRLRPDAPQPCPLGHSIAQVGQYEGFNKVGFSHNSGMTFYFFRKKCALDHRYHSLLYNLALPDCLSLHMKISTCDALIFTNFYLHFVLFDKRGRYWARHNIATLKKSRISRFQKWYWAGIVLHPLLLLPASWQLQAN